MNNDRFIFYTQDKHFFRKTDDASRTEIAGFNSLLITKEYSSNTWVKYCIIGYVFAPPTLSYLALKTL